MMHFRQRETSEWDSKFLTLVVKMKVEAGLKLSDSEDPNDGLNFEEIGTSLLPLPQPDQTKKKNLNPSY